MTDRYGDNVRDQIGLRRSNRLFDWAFRKDWRMVWRQGYVQAYILVYIRVRDRIWHRVREIIHE